MIDTIVNLFMLAGIVLVSVPVLFFASVALVHLAWAVLRKNNT
jgi:hypothetical protein